LFPMWQQARHWHVVPIGLIFDGFFKHVLHCAEQMFQRFVTKTL